MSKTITKKELKAPDQFQLVAGQGAEWFEKNIRLIIMIVVAIVVAALIWVSYGFLLSAKETRAENALFPFQTKALEKIQANTDAKSLELREYIEAVKSYSGRNAAAASAIQVIGALSTKESTESLQKEVLAAADYSPSSSHLLFGLWHQTEGQVLTRNGEFAAAKEAHQKVLKSDSHKEFHPSTLIHLGALAEKEGDLAGAKDFYLRVTREFPDTEAQKIAEKLLIHLDLLGEGKPKGS